MSNNYFVHTSSEIDKGAEIGEGTKIWHFCHISSAAKIGSNCSFGQNSYIGNVKIGNNVKVQNNVSIYDGVFIEDDVFCGPSCVFTNVINPRSGVERKSEYKETHIKRGVSIGANATIICGASIGEYSFIAAGAVVTSDTQPFSLNVGVPAKKIGWMSKWGDTMVFEKDLYICPHTQEEYLLKDDSVILVKK
ncbi:acyltransferase [Gammaproteobacteria bacterium]|nr:acyltransferase [Gammaproteobacteria bacterium]